MRITPISIGQTLRPMTPVVTQIERVEKRMASEAVAGRGRVSSSDKSTKAGKNSRLSNQRRKWGGMAWANPSTFSPERQKPKSPQSQNCGL